MLENGRAIMKSVIEIRDLTKLFPIRDSDDFVHAVSGVSFSIGKGETLGLVGESGSGKTTVGRCILRLIEPTSGTILFHGQDITQLSQNTFRQYRPKMQMIFQDPYDSLNPRQVAASIIEEPLILWNKKDKISRRHRVEELAKTVKMSYEMLEQYPHQMSGGEQQRVGIAKAIATDPELLILDEPTSSLDPSAHAEIIDLLIDLQKVKEYSYLFISHDLTAVRKVSHRVAIMYLSRLVEIGATNQVFTRPQHPYSRSLLSAVLYPDPEIKRPSTYKLHGEIPSPINLPEGCYLASRCSQAIPRCSESYPPMIDLDDGHKVACFRVTKLDDLGEFHYGINLE